MHIATVFKKSLIIFWTLWWLVALWTDIVGGLAHIGFLHASWAPDTNFPFLVTTLKMYQAKTWLAGAFFIGIIIWSAISTAAFVYAAASLGRTETVWLARAEMAFYISLSFWMAFFLADQMVMKFDLEQNHMVQGGFELLSFLALYVLPRSYEQAHSLND